MVMDADLSRLEYNSFQCAVDADFMLRSHHHRCGHLRMTLTILKPQDQLLSCPMMEMTFANVIRMQSRLWRHSSCSHP